MVLKEPRGAELARRRSPRSRSRSPAARHLDALAVVADAIHTLFRLGGEEAHVTTPFVASGEHMAPPNRIASDKIIRDGDLVFIDRGAARRQHHRDVERAVREAAAQHGLADRFISLFIGHGVGIGANEPRYIGESLAGDETVVLEEGMTFAVEPLIWIPGVTGGAGVRLEDRSSSSPTVGGR
jgi:Xaa-Pro aminopeptidase